MDDDLIKEGEEIIYNPFNPINNEITLNTVQSILTNYGVSYNIFNINLFKRAFIHKSYVKKPDLENELSDITIANKPYDCLPLNTKSNERLEFLGDGILECITKYYLYRRFPKEDEGFMTEKKIALVKNEHIGKLAYEMKLYKWFIISKNAEDKNTRTNLKKLGCLFEAFLGALFLDVNKISIKDEEGWFNNMFLTGPGFQMAQIFIENIYEKHVDWEKLINTDDNFKNQLQVIIQKEFKITPDYLEFNHDLNEGYTMGVFLSIGKNIHKLNIKESSNFNDCYKNLQEIHSEIKNKGSAFIFLAKCTHKIKRKAEQAACNLALKLINNEIIVDTNSDNYKL